MLDADESTVKTVRCRLGDKRIAVRGRVVLLAAGAFASPVLLLKSRSRHWPDGLANRSGQVGRNLMVHAHVLVAISTKKGLSRAGPLKSISLNDFYVDQGIKLGTLQSLGVTVFPGTIAYYLLTRIGNVPEALRKLMSPCVRLLAHVLAVPFRNAAIFAGIIEDLPYERNRVLLAPDEESGFRFEYHYPVELGERCRLFAKRLRAALRPHRRMLVLSGRNNLDYGHVCGTVRFGNDPASSVLNRDNRAHDVTNLYVVDASFLPSSGGTNLSLTIAANALRVGELVDARLRGAGGGP
jgi:choline dehydrogenase-like flavoprotein